MKHRFHVAYVGAALALFSFSALADQCDNVAAEVAKTTSAKAIERQGSRVKFAREGLRRFELDCAFDTRASTIEMHIDPEARLSNLHLLAANAAQVALQLPSAALEADVGTCDATARSRKATFVQAGKGVQITCWFAGSHLSGLTLEGRLSSR